MDVDITGPVKKYIGIIFIALFTLITAISFWLIQIEQDNHTAMISEGKIIHKVDKVIAPTSGMIEELHIEEGSSVEEGTLLMLIQGILSDEENLYLQRNLELSKKNLEQLQYGYIENQNSSNSTANNNALLAAQSRMDRMNSLYEMGAISAAKRNEAVAEYESMRASLHSLSQPTIHMPDSAAIEAAVRRVKTAEESLKKAQERTEGIKLFSQKKGTISELFVSSGDQVQKGDALLQINESDTVWIETDIDEADIYKIYLGQMVSYTLNHKTVQGIVQEITDITEDHQESSHRKRIFISIPLDADVFYVGEYPIRLHFIP